MGLRTAVRALDGCSGAATTALQQLVQRLEDWCSGPAESSESGVIAGAP